MAARPVGSGGWLGVALVGALQQAPSLPQALSAKEVPRFELTPVTVGDGPLLLLSRRDASTNEPIGRVAPSVIVVRSHGTPRGLVVLDLAWSCPWDVEGLPGASLTVVDRASGRVVRSFASIDVAIAPESSSIGLLEFVWLDDTTLRYADSEVAKSTDGSRGFGGTFRWVDVEFAGGTTVAIHPIGPLGLSHQEPTLEPLPACAGLRRDTLLLVGGTRQRVLLGDAATRAWGWLRPAAAR